MDTFKFDKILEMNSFCKIKRENDNLIIETNIVALISIVVICMSLPLNLMVIMYFTPTFVYMTLLLMLNVAIFKDSIMTFIGKCVPKNDKETLLNEDEYQDLNEDSDLEDEFNNKPESETESQQESKQETTEKSTNESTSATIDENENVEELTENVEELTENVEELTENVEEPTENVEESMGKTFDEEEEPNSIQLSSMSRKNTRKLMSFLKK